MKFITMLLACVILASCSNEETKKKQRQDHEIASLTFAIRQATGTDDVVFHAADSLFHIAGDGDMTLEDARGYHSNPKLIAQRKSAYVVTSTRYVKYFVESGIPGPWVQALDSAIKHWNSVGSNLIFRRVGSSTDANVKVRVKTLLPGENPNVIASAVYPSYTGRPGHYIAINLAHNGLDPSLKVFALAHEIGHNVGFTHTDGTYGAIISGTPATDPQSVMNAVVRSWGGFSQYDKLAITYIY